MPVGKLHKEAVEKVRAAFQSKAVDVILPMLDEDETAIMKRGRNAHNNHCPKNANPIEYHKATGLEVLFGYLFFEQQYERLSSIFNEIYDFLEQI